MVDCRHHKLVSFFFLLYLSFLLYVFHTSHLHFSVVSEPSFSFSWAFLSFDTFLNRTDQYRCLNNTGIQHRRKLNINISRITLIRSPKLIIFTIITSVIFIFITIQYIVFYFLSITESYESKS